MRRRDVTALALRLLAHIEGLAKDYTKQENELDPLKTLRRWQLVVLRLAEYLQEIHDQQDESERSMEAMRLTEDLSHFIESLRKGLPTLVDSIPRMPGQKVGMGVEYDLVRCCLAVTCFMNSGDSKEQAARHIAKMMKKLGVKFPPRRGNEKRAILHWQTLDNWRDKLITGEKGTNLF